MSIIIILKLWFQETMKARLTKKLGGGRVTRSVFECYGKNQKTRMCLVQEKMKIGRTGRVGKAFCFALFICRPAFSVSLPPWGIWHYTFRSESSFQSGRVMMYTDVAVGA